MKSTVKWMVVMIVTLLLAAGPAIAGNGTCPNNKMGAQAKQRIGGLNCPLITEGEPVTIAGTVYETAAAGAGLLVDTGTEIVAVYGIGPIWYWDSLGVARPEVGEEIQIDSLLLVYSDATERLIAVTILVDGEMIDLRDPVDGKTLWRRAGRR